MNNSLLDALCADGDGNHSFPSTVIVAAHPDDETVSAGGRLAYLKDCTVVNVTDGAPRDMRDATAAGFPTREAYARARRGELAAALALVGIGMDQTRVMGVVDQEASLDLVTLAGHVAETLRELKPDVVLTHPYEGGHPDHDATAFAVHAATQLLVRGGAPAPELIEFTSYHDKHGWMSFFEFLPCGICPTTTVLLSNRVAAVKRQMVECFVTQQKTIAPFPIELERFRPAPHYDFSAPPHPGTLYYERFDWGMTGARWRRQAQAALDHLHLDVKL